MHPQNSYPHVVAGSCFLPWSFLISVCLFIKTVGEKVLLSILSLFISVSKGRFIEQVLTDIWIDFMLNAYSIVPVSN